MFTGTMAYPECQLVYTVRCQQLRVQGKKRYRCLTMSEETLVLFGGEGI